MIAVSEVNKLPLTRLLTGYQTAEIEPQDDGSVLVYVESDHPDLLLATLALPAAVLDRFDLREFPDLNTRRRRAVAYIRRRRAEPAFRERERAKNRERMRRARDAKKP